MAPLALFDLDDTLIAMAPAFRRFAQDFAESCRVARRRWEWLVEAVESRYSAPRGVLRPRAGTLCAAEPVDDLWRLYRTRMPEFVELRDEVRAGLVALRHAGWRLGIVTNGEADNQLGKIERTGLDRLVDAVAVSGALGIRKPDPEIFRIAAEGAGCPLSDGGWMVGDNPHADIEGGAAVGLRTVWIDRDREAAAPAATAVVKDVVEAFPLLLTYR